MKGIVSVVAALLLAAPAQADQVLPVMQKAGLMGTWAANCDAPEAANNPFVVYYVAANGLVRRRLERGAAGPTLDGTVDRAEALGPTTYRLLLRNEDPNWGSNDGRTFDTIVEVNGERARAVQSMANDGTQLIKDGRYATAGGAGTAVPILMRCTH